MEGVLLHDDSENDFPGWTRDEIELYESYCRFEEESYTALLRITLSAQSRRSLSSAMSNGDWILPKEDFLDRYRRGDLPDDQIGKWRAGYQRTLQSDWNGLLERYRP